MQRIDTAKKMSLKLFLPKGYRRIKVPNFQRNYVWRSANITHLLAMLISEQGPYYIGTFVIASREVGSNSFDEIIDGQQRIVTLSFILAFLLNNYTLAKKDKIISFLFEDANKKMPRLKFESQNVNMIFLKTLKGQLSKEDEKSKGDEVKSSVVKSYLSIEKIVKRTMTQNDISPDDLVDKILDLEFVVIIPNRDSDVLLFYRTLNSTSKPLSPVELIKSLLVGEQAVTKAWQTVEKNFRGLSPEVLSRFIRYHWFTIGGKTTNAKLYDKIKNYYKEKQEDYEKDLVLSHEIYLYCYLPTKGPDLKRLLPRTTSPIKNNINDIDYLLSVLRTLGLEQVYIPVLGLIKYSVKNPTYIENRSLVKVIESILCFSILTKYTPGFNPNSVETMYADFANNINKPGANVESIVYNLIKEFKIIIKESIQKKKFCKDVISKIHFSSKDSKTPQKFVEYLLYKYHKYGSTISHVKPPLGTTIEHIFPQGEGAWRRNWSSTSLPAQKFLLQEGGRLSIGNLTLTCDDRGSDKGFEYKFKQMYGNDDNFPKNKQLDTYSDFVSTQPHHAVKQRGKDICDNLYDALVKFS